MRPSSKFFAAAATLALVLGSAGTAFADDSTSSAQTDADAVAQSVDDVAPDTPGDAVTPLADDGTTLTGDSGTTAVEVPKDDGGSVSLSSADDPDKVSVGLPGGDGSDAVVASDGTVTYQDSLPSTDVAVQPLEDSVRLSTVIQDGDAPTTFTYPVDLPDGATMAVQDDGSVVITKSDGSLGGGFAAPWAKDANGVDVPTHYEVQGDDLVQVVEHTTTPGVAYPVVADPWLWRDLIHSATWTYHTGYGWTLKVTPTDWQRFWSGVAPAYAGWNELYSKYRNRGLNTNLGSMENQYVCHVLIVNTIAPNKATWDLDEWRPNVGLTDTINHKCNPGPGGFPGEW